MSGYSTIRIPVDMSTRIEIVQREGITHLHPLHVAEVCNENPDDYGLAFYADYGDEQNVEANQRATMIALAVDQKDKHADAPIIMGDVVLLCDEELARLIVENDSKFQEDAKVVSSFRAWLEDYAEVRGVDKAAVFYAVGMYVDHVIREAALAAQDDRINKVAAVLGLSPEQIGLIVL